MGRRTHTPWLAVLTIGFLTAGCAVGGSVVPGGSGRSAPVASVPAVASATPTARPTVSSTPSPTFAEARIPKEPVGVPPENAPVVFQEVGLRGGHVVRYALTGEASASYQCRNPKTAAFGTQKETVTGRVTAVATLTAGADGTIRSILQLRLPPPHKLSCSTGFQAVAYAGRYDHVLLADATNDLRVDLGTYQFIVN